MSGQRTAMVVALALLAGTAVRGNAQNWRFDLGVNGGGSVLSSGLDEDQLGVTGGIEMDAGWLAGAQASLWMTPHVGLRANFAHTNRELSFDDNETLLGDNRNLIRDVKLWTGTGDILLRFVSPSDRYTGTELLPYVTGGVGARWVNPPGDNFSIDLNASRTGETFTVGGNTYFVEERAVPLFRAGIGTDARVSRNMAFRLELGDMMWKAPIHSTSEVNGTQVSIEDEDIGDLQHEFYATLGLHVLVGADRGLRVATTTRRPRR